MSKARLPLPALKPIGGPVRGPNPYIEAWRRLAKAGFIALAPFATPLRGAGPVLSLGVPVSLLDLCAVHALRDLIR